MIFMETSSIIETVLAAVIAVMGYFLKVIHSDVRKNTERSGECKGRIDTLNTRIDHESEMRNQAFNNIMDSLMEIKQDIKDLKK